MRGAPVGHGGGHHQHVGACDYGADRVEHVAGGDDVDARDAGGRLEGNGAGNERHLVARRARGARHGEAHPSRGRIREEAHGVDELARGAGCDDEPHRSSRALARTFSAVKPKCSASTL